jgi:hypothetical protein
MVGSAVISTQLSAGHFSHSVTKISDLTIDFLKRNSHKTRLAIRKSLPYKILIIIILRYI